MVVVKFFHIYFFIPVVLCAISCTSTKDPTTTILTRADHFKTKVFQTGLDMEEGFTVNAFTHTFVNLVCYSSFFIDNSLLLWYIFTQERMVVTLPRAFGKTINLHMIKYFYGMEVCESTLKPIPQNETLAYQTFEMGKIQCGSELMDLKDKFLVSSLRHYKFYKHLGSVPIIHLNFGRPDTFKSLKDVYKLIQDRIQDTLDAHKYIMFVPSSEVDNRIRWHQNMYRELQVLMKDNGDEKYLVAVASRLIKLLHSIFARKVFVIIDEYDAILNKIHFGNSALDANERRNVLEFFAMLYGDIAKQDDYVGRVFLTGILSWRGGDIFTSITRMSYETVNGGDSIHFYGANQDIVMELLTSAGLNYTHTTVINYYNGYNFGKSPDYIRKYNPYAIACFIKAKGISTNMDFWTTSGSVSSMLRDLVKYKSFFQYFIQLLYDMAIKIKTQKDITTFTIADLDSFSKVILEARDAHECKWNCLESSEGAIELLGFNVLLVTGYLTESISHPPDFQETEFSNVEFRWVQVTNQEVQNDLWTEFVPILMGQEVKCPVSNTIHWRSSLRNCGEQLGQILPSNNFSLQKFATSFENVISNYIPSTWKIKDEERRAYANEALFVSLLTTIIHYSVHNTNMGLKQFETQYQFGFSDKRRPDVVIQSQNNLITIFELKYCRGTVLNIWIIEEMLKNATTQGIEYAKWYLWGTYHHLYKSPGVRLIVLLVTEFENRVILRTTYLPVRCPLLRC